MDTPHGGTIPMETLFDPKVVGELAFVLKEDLKGPAVYRDNESLGGMSYLSELLNSLL
jgi:hypothetical protein